jgi:hypothetical protein
VERPHLLAGSAPPPSAEQAGHQKRKNAFFMIFLQDDAATGFDETSHLINLPG